MSSWHVSMSDTIVSYFVLVFVMFIFVLFLVMFMFSWFLPCFMFSNHGVFLYWIVMCFGPK